MAEEVRAFIAIQLPQRAREVLARLIAALEAQGLSGVKWVSPEGMHLTLRFLGNIEVARLREVLEAMARAAEGVAPFSLALEGTGGFPNLGQPRILWVGLKGDVERVRQLQARLERELEGVGIPQEGRPFSAHITLGRVREGTHPLLRRRLGEALSRTSVPVVPPWDVRSLTLMRSTLTPAGPIYTPLGEIHLSPPLSKRAQG